VYIMGIEIERERENRTEEEEESSLVNSTLHSGCVTCGIPRNWPTGSYKCSYMQRYLFCTF
jgi:hypothetical protein